MTEAEHVENLERQCASLKQRLRVVAAELRRRDAEIAALQGRLRTLDPPRGGCGIRYHHATCNCGGVGGDR